jgi:hypothetical protein
VAKYRIERGELRMIRLDDFDKVRKYVKKWAKEKGIEVVYISVDDEELIFYGKTRGCATPIVCTYWIRDKELELDCENTTVYLWDM